MHVSISVLLLLNRKFENEQSSLRSFSSIVSNLMYGLDHMINCDLCRMYMLKGESMYSIMFICLWIKCWFCLSHHNWSTYSSWSKWTCQPGTCYHDFLIHLKRQFGQICVVCLWLSLFLSNHTWLVSKFILVFTCQLNWT